MTVPIDQSTFGHALDLLEKGFPSVRRSVWEAGLERWMTSPGHRSGDEPIGHLLAADSRFVGIGLTAVSRIPDPTAASEGTRRRVNLASWYIEPGHRLKLPVLLRRLLADPSAIYTDLTPAPAVLPILERLGFVPLNDGVALVNLAAAALRPTHGAHASMRDGARPMTGWHERMTQDHVSYGCLALDLHHAEGVTMLLLKPLRIKRVPLLELVYCEDATLCRSHLGAIARALLRMGHFGLLIDLPIEQPVPAGLTYVPFRTRRRRLARNAPASRGIDHTYSELVFFRS